jgi:hypothetical protein
MDCYYIVKIGGLPGSHVVTAANLGGTCDAWTKSADKEHTEVIAVSSSGVVSRLTASESERIAYNFRSPKIK